MIPDFQLYLESIRAAYGRWQERYTPTDAQGRENIRAKQSATFDFGLMVQTVKREERERRDEEKVECFPVLEGIRKYVDHHHVLLVGRPGSGKSTALARLMLEEATTLQARIPVLVELRYWQGSIEQLIRDSLTRHDLPDEQVEAVLQRFAQSATAKETLILFDGVNELPSEEARSQLSAFRRNHPKVPMIFTTRDLSLGGDLGIEKKLEMQPLTEAQMQAFIRSYVPEQAEEMLRQLKDRLREFGQTPLLLWMLCELFQQTGTIPENLGLVFREFTRGYERYLKEDVRIESDRAWWKPVLQQLAWVMMQGEKPTELRVAIRREEAVRAIGQFLDRKVPYAEDFAQKCLRDLQKYHLIQIGTNPEELEFRHQLIQEYYAAEALLERLEKLDVDDEQFKQEFLNYLKWTEPIALMMALADEALAVQVVKLALKLDQRLGARLAGEVKIEFQKKTVELVDVLKIPSWLKIKLLEETKSDDAVPKVLKLLKHPNTNLRKSAVLTLGELGSNAAVSHLLKLLKDPEVCWSAVTALSKLGSDSTFPNLLELIESSDNNARRCAVAVLSKIGSYTAMPSLLKLTQDCDSFVRRSAACGLGNIGSTTAVSVLLTLLEDSDFLVCERAALALIQIDSEEAIPVLLKLAEHSEPDVRWAVASALGEVDSEESTFALLKLLEDSDYGVFVAAAETLGRIGSERAVPTLLKLLKDSEVRVRALAADVLGMIGLEVAVPALLELLEDSDSLVCVCAANALGMIGLEVATPALFKLLEHSDGDVRASAACLLGSIDAQEAVPALVRLAKEDSASFYDVAPALGKLDAQAAIPVLLELIESSEWTVRKSAAEVLGELGSAEAVPALIKLLEDIDNYIRKNAVEALSNIAKKRPGFLALHLSYFLTLILTDAGEEAFNVILAIQENCKFYNYEVFQAHLEAQKNDRHNPQTNDRSTTIYHIQSVGNLNTGTVNIAGDQIGVESSTPDLD